MPSNPIPEESEGGRLDRQIFENPLRELMAWYAADG